MAYESIEKYKEAKADLIRVKELQPSNILASQCLTRVNKAIISVEKEHHEDF